MKGHMRKYFNKLQLFGDEHEAPRRTVGDEKRLEAINWRSTSELIAKDSQGNKC